MDDDIFHLRIVNGALRRGAPRFFGRIIVVVKADDVQVIQAREVEAARIVHAAPEDEV